MSIKSIHGVGATQWVARIFYPTVVCAVLLLAGCEFGFTLPTATPTHSATGPTVAPSPTLFIPTPGIDSPNTIGDIGQNDLTAASLPSRSGLPPLAVGTESAGNVQSVQITAEDGAMLLGDLYQDPTRAVRLPGILMLGPNRTGWGDFPALLRDSGFTVLVMEMRDPSIINQQDFAAMMQALSETGSVNPGAIGVIGAGVGADAALLGCSADAMCDTVVLLSPTNGDLLQNALPTYNPRPLMLSASRDDAAAFAVVSTLGEAAAGEILLQPFDSAGRGADILRNRADFGELVIAWFTRHLLGT
ncbi:MAG: hypothetical protein H7175_08940 [Burkholderiales bacterium]|nr:hypothetical protein [Anaerolineae bacterium]